MNNLHPVARSKSTPTSSQSTPTAFARAGRAIYIQKLSTQAFLVWFMSNLIYTVCTTGSPKSYIPSHSNPFLLTLFAFVTLKTALAIRINLLFQGNHLSDEIQRTDDPKYLGCLLDVIDTASTEERSSLLSERGVPDAIYNAIKRLLRQADEEDLSALNSRQRIQLFKLLLPAHNLNLEKRYDPQLALTLLGVLERMRTHEALPYVRRLARRSDMQLVIHATAQQCLICLEESLAQQQTNQTLLRPSAASTPPDMLLRPAVDTKQTASEAMEQLLRSTASLEAVPAFDRNTALLPNCELTASQEQSLVQQIQTGPKTE